MYICSRSEAVAAMIHILYCIFNVHILLYITNKVQLFFCNDQVLYVHTYLACIVFQYEKNNYEN